MVGSFVGPLLANIIMTEMNKTVIKKFNDDRILLLGRCFVTLVTIKPEHLKLVQDALNSFDKKLNFTSDTFDHVVPIFLTLKLIQMA